MRRKQEDLFPGGSVQLHSYQRSSERQHHLIVMSPGSGVSYSSHPRASCVSALLTCSVDSAITPARRVAMRRAIAQLVHLLVQLFLFPMAGVYSDQRVPIFTIKSFSYRPKYSTCKAHVTASGP